MILYYPLSFTKYFKTSRTQIWLCQSCNHKYIAFFILQATFEEMFDGEEEVQVLVCFYAHWASDVRSYLTAFSMTVDAYREAGGNLKFGLVDLIQDSSKKCKLF